MHNENSAPSLSHFDSLYSHRPAVRFHSRRCSSLQAASWAWITSWTRGSQWVPFCRAFAKKMPRHTVSKMSS